MLDIDLASLYQHRMDKCAAEQFWAIALLASMNGFILHQKDKLLSAIEKPETIRRGIAIATGVACLYIWSRHAVYVRYDHLLNPLIAADGGPQIADLSLVEKAGRQLVMLLGVGFYTAIAIVMARVSYKSLVRKVTISEG